MIDFVGWDGRPTHPAASGVSLVYRPSRHAVGGASEHLDGTRGAIVGVSEMERYERELREWERRNKPR